jgi:hypothetical protein
VAHGRTSRAEFLDRLRATTEFLETLIANRGLLAHASPDDQRRLLQAAGLVYAPDAAARRQLVRATDRRRKPVTRERSLLSSPHFIPAITSSTCGARTSSPSSISWPLSSFSRSNRRRESAVSPSEILISPS